jgi:hypothetical protein
MSKLISYFMIVIVLVVASAALAARSGSTILTEQVTQQTSASAQIPLETQAVFRGEQVLQDSRLPKIALMPNGNVRAWGGPDLLEVDANGALVAARRMVVQHSLIESGTQHVVETLPGKCRVRTLGTDIARDTQKVDVTPIGPATLCSPVALINGEAFLFAGNDEVLTRISADFATQTKLNAMASAARSRMRYTDVVAIDNKIVFYADTENGAAIVAVDRTGQTLFTHMLNSPGSIYGPKLLKDGNTVYLSWYTSLNVGYFAAVSAAGELLIPTRVAGAIPVASVGRAFLKHQDTLVSIYDEGAIAVYDPVAGARVISVGIPGALNGGSFDAQGNLWVRTYFSGIPDSFVKIDLQGNVLQRFLPEGIVPGNIIVADNQLILSGSKQVKGDVYSAWVARVRAEDFSPIWQIQPTTLRSPGQLQVRTDATQTYAYATSGSNGSDVTRLIALDYSNRIRWQRIRSTDHQQIEHVTAKGVWVIDRANAHFYSHEGALEISIAGTILRARTLNNGESLLLTYGQKRFEVLRLAANGAELGRTELPNGYQTFELSENANAVYGQWRATNGAISLKKLSLAGAVLWSSDCEGFPIAEDLDGNIVCYGAQQARLGYSATGRLRWSLNAPGARFSRVQGTLLHQVDYLPNGGLAISQQSILDGSIVSQEFARAPEYTNFAPSVTINSDGSILTNARTSAKNCFLHVSDHAVLLATYCEPAASVYTNDFYAWLNQAGGIHAGVLAQYGEAPEIQFKSSVEIFRGSFESASEY